MSLFNNSFLVAAALFASPLTAQQTAPSPQTGGTGESDGEVAEVSTLLLKTPQRSSLETFENRVNDALESRLAPGLVFLVIDDGEISFAKGYGYADIGDQTPVTPDTVFAIGSISKTFIGTAAAIAHNDGAFNMSEPISNYLSFAIDDPRPTGGEISFLHLATHTSGIIDYEPAYDQAYAMGSPVHPVSLPDYLQSYLTAEGELFDAQQNFLRAPPGRQHSYSNIASGFAAQALSDKLETPFDAYTQRVIFSPFGMTSTTWFLPHVDPAQLGLQYERTETGFAPYPPYALATWPDGGLRSTANDLARYLIAMTENGELDGHQVIAPAAVNTALSGIDLRGASDLPEDELLAGLFWGTSKAPGALQSRPLLGHNGADPGIWTVMQFDPITNRGVIAIANTDMENAQQLRQFYGLAYSLFLTNF